MDQNRQHFRLKPTGQILVQEAHKGRNILKDVNKSFWGNEGAAIVGYLLEDGAIFEIELSVDFRRGYKNYREVFTPRRTVYNSPDLEAIEVIETTVDLNDWEHR